MHKFLLRLVASLAVFAASCGSQFTTEEAFVDAIGAAKLRSYADEMQRNEGWRNLKGQPAPNSMWLSSFATNGVIQVKPYSSGVLFVLETQGRNERGVCVLAEGAEQPEDGSGINFAQIRSRIYWFEQKVREHYIPLEQRSR